MIGTWLSNFFFCNYVSTHYYIIVILERWLILSRVLKSMLVPKTIDNLAFKGEGDNEILKAWTYQF